MSAPTSWLRPLGSTRLTVTAVGAGGGPLGTMRDNCGYAVAERRGVGTAVRIVSGQLN